MIAEFHHPGELDFLDVVGRVFFVPTGSFVLVVVPKEGATAVGESVVERVAVSTGVLWVVRPIDFPSNDGVTKPVLFFLDDREPRPYTMG